MPDKKLFSSAPGKHIPRTDTVNEAGGTAYAFTVRHALAQLAVTGTLPGGGSYYKSGQDGLKEALNTAAKCEAGWIAKCAIYAAEHGMKDMPALLLAYLSTCDIALTETVFPRIVHNSRMLRGFCQILRSDVVGRKSFGRVLKRCIRQWLDSRSEYQLFGDAVGGKSAGGVSIADIIKMVHPKPANAEREALYGYIIGKEGVPDVVRAYEAFKAGETEELPNVRWELLTALDLKPEHWKLIARRAGWRQAVKQLNTFHRHQVLDDPETVEILAQKIADEETISKLKPFPHELVSAYKFGITAPQPILDALHAAMEYVTAYVKVPAGKVLLGVDVSGSMGSPVTGWRGSATGKLCCTDVACLLAAVVAKRNPDAQVIPFDTKRYDIRIDRMNPILTTAEQLSQRGGGGTSVSIPLAWALDTGFEPDHVILLSDNESWADSRGSSAATKTMRCFRQLQQKVPHLRMVCLDLQPDTSTQAADEADVLNLGGWSNQLWSVIVDFLEHGQNPDDPNLWLQEIDAITIDGQ